MHKVRGKFHIAAISSGALSLSTLEKSLPLSATYCTTDSRARISGYTAATAAFLPNRVCFCFCSLLPLSRRTIFAEGSSTLPLFPLTAASPSLFALSIRSRMWSGRSDPSESTL